VRRVPLTRPGPVAGRDDRPSARWRDVALAAGGTAVVAVLGAACAGGDVLTGERAVFEALNGLPALVGWPVRAVMQLGDAKLILAIALLAHAAWRRWWLTATVVTAGASAWLIANRVKEIVDRARPDALLDDVVLREDTDGRGFPSGHCAISTAMAIALLPHVPARWRWLVCAVPLVVGVGRVHVGAHLPLDVAGGVALGAALGATARLVLGTRAEPGR
jgi:undecaprenyl-diphosphatase